jgi:hypothetical protein
MMLIFLFFTFYAKVEKFYREHLETIISLYTLDDQKYTDSLLEINQNLRNSWYMYRANFHKIHFNYEVLLDKFNQNEECNFDFYFKIHRLKKITRYNDLEREHEKKAKFFQSAIQRKKWHSQTHGYTIDL